MIKAVDEDNDYLMDTESEWIILPDIKNDEITIYREKRHCNGLSMSYKQFKQLKTVLDTITEKQLDR